MTARNPAIYGKQYGQPWRHNIGYVDSLNDDLTGNLTPDWVGKGLSELFYNWWDTNYAVIKNRIFIFGGNGYDWYSPELGVPPLPATDRGGRIIYTIEILPDKTLGPVQILDNKLPYHMGDVCKILVNGDYVYILGNSRLYYDNHDNSFSYVTDYHSELIIRAKIYENGNIGEWQVCSSFISFDVDNDRLECFFLEDYLFVVVNYPHNGATFFRYTVKEDGDLIDEKLIYIDHLNAWGNIPFKDWVEGYIDNNHPVSSNQFVDDYILSSDMFVLGKHIHFIVQPVIYDDQWNYQFAPMLLLRISLEDFLSENIDEDIDDQVAHNYLDIINLGVLTKGRNLAHFDLLTSVNDSVILSLGFWGNDIADIEIYNGPTQLTQGLSDDTVYYNLKLDVHTPNGYPELKTQSLPDGYKYTVNSIQAFYEESGTYDFRDYLRLEPNLVVGGSVYYFTTDEDLWLQPGYDQFMIVRYDWGTSNIGMDLTDTYATTNIEPGDPLQFTTDISFNLIFTTLPDPWYIKIGLGGNPGPLCDLGQRDGGKPGYGLYGIKTLALKENLDSITLTPKTAVTVGYIGSNSLCSHGPS